MGGLAPGAVALVAGSGVDLGPLLDEELETLPFTAFPELASCTVPGHAARFVRGRCGDTELIIQEGRLHVYEGASVAQVARTVDVLYELGARNVVFTNAAGGLRKELACGNLVAVDELALWPCQRWRRQPARVRPSVVLEGCAGRGTYVWVHGPSYETRAEIAAMAAQGYACVGMSTAPELVRANDLGLITAVVSCITNNCTTPQRLTHEHVLHAAATASQGLCGLIRRWLRHR